MEVSFHEEAMNESSESPYPWPPKGGDVDSP